MKGRSYTPRHISSRKWCFSKVEKPLSVSAWYCRKPRAHGMILGNVRRWGESLGTDERLVQWRREHKCFGCLGHGFIFWIAEDRTVTRPTSLPLL